MNSETRVLRHIVLFKLKDETSKEKVTEVENALAGLKTKIPFILNLEWGINVSPEGKSQGYTHVFSFTFKSEEDRDAYLPHPDHKAAASILEEVLEKICVMDYFVRT